MKTIKHYVSTLTCIALICPTLAYSAGNGAQRDVNTINKIVKDAGGAEPMTSQLNAVNTQLRTKYPNTKFTQISPTPIPGIYEVVMGKNVAYVEGNGRYFIFGHLFDMETQTDLTEDKLQQQVKIDFNTLPLQYAIKTVRGNGKRVMAVFSDPDCPYCKKLEQELVKLDNVTIYTFLYPLEQLHQDAKNKAEAIWCSKDRSKAWLAFMLNGKLPDSASGCSTPIQKIREIAENNNISGTPFIVSAEGKTIAGAAESARIDAWLGDAK